MTNLPDNPDQEIAESDDSLLTAHLIASLATETRPVYALIDTARDDDLNDWLPTTTFARQCLFTGELAARANRAAPWLVSRRDDPAAFDRLLAEDFGKNAYLVIVADLPGASLLDHCQGLLNAGHVDGSRYLFRFYDPEVLLTFIPVLTWDQRIAVFGSIARFIAPAGTQALIEMHLDDLGGIPSILHQVQSGQVVQTPTRLSLPALDLSGALAVPHLCFTQMQLDAPLLFNRPRLVAHLARYLDPEFTERKRCYPPGLLHAMLSHGADLATRVYGIYDVANIALFVDLQWRIAPGWHRHPVLRRVLENQTVTADARFARLGMQAFDAAWEEALQQACSDDWFWEPEAGLR